MIAAIVSIFKTELVGGLSLQVASDLLTFINPLVLK